MSNARSLEAIFESVGGCFVNLGNRGFVFGSQGKLLRRNVEALWFDHCVTAPPYNVFLSSSDKLSDTLTILRDASSDSRPFGLACIENSKTVWNSEFHPSDCKSFSHKTASVSVVTDGENGQDLFHRKQRERKVWWRKFARNPSIFSLTESKIIGKNRETIDIMAKFPFGNIIVESIAYQQDAKKIYPQMEQNDCSEVRVVEHMASLDWGCLAMICDSYEMEDDIGELKIHPKLSPYKVGFCLENNEREQDPKSQEKTRLLFYLNNLLKSKGLDTVLTRTKRGLKYFHVPLTISIDNASLENGIISVTSQLTRIAEAVHVTDLVKYVTARCA